MILMMSIKLHQIKPWPGGQGMAVGVLGQPLPAEGPWKHQRDFFGRRFLPYIRISKPRLSTRMKRVNHPKFQKPLLLFMLHSFIYLFIFSFLWPYLWHKGVPRLGVQLELQLPSYTTVISIPDSILICHVH